MPNLYYTATEIVAQLKQLLTERYRRGRGELGVLKEIVQNADDAGATRLDFVLSRDGIAGADNPLLRGPSLACINDGRFRREDERALRTMGRTSKAEDLGAIGRFGVGQKSVFHLAEAYFSGFRRRPPKSLVSRGEIPSGCGGGRPGAPAAVESRSS